MTRTSRWVLFVWAASIIAAGPAGRAVYAASVRRSMRCPMVNGRPPCATSLGLPVMIVSEFQPDETGTAHVEETAQSEGDKKNASGKGSGKEESEHEGYFKIINFALLLAGFIYLLRKPLRGFLADRSENIESALQEGRTALEHSQQQLRSIEEKLKHLEEEIAGFKSAAVSEMEAERQRLHEAAEDEAARILDAARAQIENSARAARLSLKSYAAEQALQLAEARLRQRLDENAQQQLVYRFAQEVKNGSASRS